MGKDPARTAVFLILREITQQQRVEEKTQLSICQLRNYDLMAEPNETERSHGFFGLSPSTGPRQSKKWLEPGEAKRNRCLVVWIFGPHHFSANGDEFGAYSIFQAWVYNNHYVVKRSAYRTRTSSFQNYRNDIVAMPKPFKQALGYL